MSTELVAVQTAVAEFDKVGAGIAELEKKYKGVVYDVSTTAGLDAAKEARLQIRAPRFAIENLRKAAKAPILKLGKDLDARAAEITEKILAIEIPIDKQIKTEEDRKEAEKQARIAAELKRVTEIRTRIDTIRAWPTHYAGRASALVEQAVRVAREYVIDTTFAEFAEEATRTLGESLKGLEAELERARQREAERDELERLRKEAEAREVIEAARRKLESTVRAQLATIRDMAATAVTASAADIVQAIEALTHITFNPAAFGEFHTEIEDARAATLATLRQQYAAATQREMEQAHAAAERAELDRLRAEQADRERAERIAAEDAARAKARTAEAEETAARRAAVVAELDKEQQEIAERAKAHGLGPTPDAGEFPPLTTVFHTEAIEVIETVTANHRPKPADSEIADAVAFAFGVEAEIAHAWLLSYGLFDEARAA
jgi:hypothetical protein